MGDWMARMFYLSELICEILRCGALLKKRWGNGAFGGSWRGGRDRRSDLRRAIVGDAHFVSDSPFASLLLRSETEAGAIDARDQ